jgi:hypothetical protein
MSSKPTPQADSGTEFAWCWASGLIEFGTETPSGAIAIASGPADLLRLRVGAIARHGIGANEGKLLAPGVVEAPNQNAACDALIALVKWCKEKEPAGSQITWARG